MWMLRKPVTSLSRAGLVLAAAAIVFAGGLGLGSGLSLTRAQADGEISACVNRFTGYLRVVNGTGKCASSERPLSWNRQGPPGLFDIQFVRNSVTVETVNQASGIAVLAECPAGYRVVGGGAGQGVTVGDDIWALFVSAPVPAGSLENDTWVGMFKTVDGSEAEGSYEFTAHAVCALTG